MNLSIIAAMGRNRAIGSRGSLPWSIPADLQRFKALTLGHTVIMGRKTYESIGRPLAHRQNIILSRGSDFHPEGVLIATSLGEAMALAGSAEEVFICGGADLYRQALPLVTRIYLTLIDIDVEGDTFFPETDFAGFNEVSRERLSEDPPADFITLERVLYSSSGTLR